MSDPIGASQGGGGWFQSIQGAASGALNAVKSTATSAMESAASKVKSLGGLLEPLNKYIETGKANKRSQKRLKVIRKGMAKKEKQTGIRAGGRVRKVTTGEIKAAAFVGKGAEKRIGELGKQIKVERNKAITETAGHVFSLVSGNAFIPIAVKVINAVAAGEMGDLTEPVFDTLDELTGDYMVANTAVKLLANLAGQMKESESLNLGSVKAAVLDVAKDVVSDKTGIPLSSEDLGDQVAGFFLSPDDRV
jgi:hypothetical protein